MKRIDLNMIRRYQEIMPINIEKHSKKDIYIIGYYNNLIINKKMVWNHQTVLCRGLIVDEEGVILERSFNKFWTFRQYLSANTILMSSDRKYVIDPSSRIVKVNEKLDGTMCVLYWINDIPYLATQRTFSGEKAERATQILHQKYLEKAKKLDRNHTYLFEAIYPESKILVDYGNIEDLFLIGMINKKTGNSIDFSVENLGFPMCQDYTDEYSSLDLDELQSLNLNNKEGFVVTYDNGFMVKVKFPWYSDLHKYLDNLITMNFLFNKAIVDFSKVLSYSREITSIDVWESLKSGDKEFSNILKNSTDLHYMAGLKKWLEDEAEKIQQGYKMFSNEKLSELNWDLIKPVNGKINYFKIYKNDELINKLLKSDNTMINWRKRLLKRYI